MRQVYKFLKTNGYLFIEIQKDMFDFNVDISSMLFFKRKIFDSLITEKFCYLKKSATGKKEIIGRADTLTIEDWSKILPSLKINESTYYNNYIDSSSACYAIAASRDSLLKFLNLTDNISNILILKILNTQLSKPVINMEYRL